MTIGTVFIFAAPDGWSEIRDGNRYIFHGPNGGELIVSASLIQGVGRTGDLTTIQQRLFQNAEESVKNAVAHPALKVTQPFQQDVRTTKIKCWSLLAETSEEDTLFYQAVFHDARGVLLATFESPNTMEAVNAFDQFIKSVGVMSESGTVVE